MKLAKRFPTARSRDNLPVPRCSLSMAFAAIHWHFHQNQHMGLSENRVYSQL